MRSFKGNSRSHRNRAALTVCVIGVLAIVVGVTAGWAAVRAEPAEVGGFYEEPGNLPGVPGHLLKHEPFGRGLPANSRAERILYTTTDLDGAIRVASGIVIVPTAAADGPRPVVLWAHGATGVAPSCAPSLLEDPLGSGAMPAQQEVIDNGWVLVVPDYIGLGTEGPHPFLIGQPDARASLDAVRAARELDGLGLSGQTVVWGHSQGGAVALWTGIEATTYAPDVPLVGVAALAPAADLPSLAAGLASDPIGMLLGAFLVDAYSAVYPDVSIDEYVTAAERDEFEAVLGRCLSSPATWLSIGALVAGEPLFRRAATDGPLGDRLAENVPGMPSGVPTFVGQGGSDTLVGPAPQTAFVAALCAAGQAIDYHIYEGRGHLDIVAEGSPMVPDLLAWTHARFAGEPPASACTTTGR